MQHMYVVYLLFLKDRNPQMDEMLLTSSEILLITCCTFSATSLNISRTIRLTRTSVRCCWTRTWRFAGASRRRIQSSTPR